VLQVQQQERPAAKRSRLARRRLYLAVIDFDNCTELNEMSGAFDDERVGWEAAAKVSIA